MTSAKKRISPQYAILIGLLQNRSVFRRFTVEHDRLPRVRHDFLKYKMGKLKRTHDSLVFLIRRLFSYWPRVRVGPFHHSLTAPSHGIGSKSSVRFSGINCTEDAMIYLSTSQRSPVLIIANGPNRTTFFAKRTLLDRVDRQNARRTKSSSSVFVVNRPTGLLSPIAGVTGKSSVRAQPRDGVSQRSPYGSWLQSKLRQTSGRIKVHDPFRQSHAGERGFGRPSGQAVRDQFAHPGRDYTYRVRDSPARNGDAGEFCQHS